MGQGTGAAPSESKAIHYAIDLRKTYVDLVERPPLLPLILSGLQPKTCRLATQHDAVMVEEIARKSGVVHIGRHLNSATNRSTFDGVELSTRLPARNELAKRNLPYRCLGFLTAGPSRSMVFYDQDDVSVMGFMKAKGAKPNADGTRPRVPARVKDRWVTENTEKGFRGGFMHEGADGQCVVLNVIGKTDASGSPIAEAFELTYELLECPCYVKCRYSGQTKRLLEVTVSVKSAARKVQPSRYLLYEETDISPLNSDWGLNVREQVANTDENLPVRVIVRQAGNDTVSVVKEKDVSCGVRDGKLRVRVVTWPTETQGIEEEVMLDLGEFLQIDDAHINALLDFQHWHPNAIPLEGVIEEIVGNNTGPNGIRGTSTVITTA